MPEGIILDDGTNVVITRKVKAGTNLSISFDGDQIPQLNSVSGAVEVQEGETQKVASAQVLDFAAGEFDVTESPANEANISIDTVAASKISAGTFGAGAYTITGVLTAGVGGSVKVGHGGGATILVDGTDAPLAAAENGIYEQSGQFTVQSRSHLYLRADEDATGTGSVFLRTGATNRWEIDENGDLIPVANASYDIGAAAGNRPAAIYADAFDSDGDITCGGELAFDSAGGRIDFNGDDFRWRGYGTSDPGTPAAGDFWIRTDLPELRSYDGSTTYTVSLGTTP